MTDRSVSEAYRRTRERISELVSGLSPEELTQALPTCPDWSTRDVLGHLAGLLADVAAGRTEGAGSPEWTAAQVEAFADHDLADLLARWAELAAAFEADAAAAAGPMGPRIVSDLYTHEQDIRGALDRRGHRDDPALAISLEVQLATLAERLAAAGLPALQVRAGDGLDRAVGDGEPRTVVSAPSTWELVRCLLARRSRGQVAALGWTGDRVPDYLAVFFRFEPPGADLVE